MILQKYVCDDGGAKRSHDLSSRPILSLSVAVHLTAAFSRQTLDLHFTAEVLAWAHNRFSRILRTRKDFQEAPPASQRPPSELHPCRSHASTYFSTVLFPKMMFGMCCAQSVGPRLLSTATVRWKSFKSLSATPTSPTQQKTSGASPHTLCRCGCGWPPPCRPPPWPSR